MKTLLIGFIIGASLQLSARTFTSADGSRTMEAQLFSYSPSSDRVVLQIAGQSTRTTTKASLFSEEDQEYFKEFLKESEKFNALRISSKAESESFKDDRGLYIYDKEKEHFNVTIENRADFALEKLKAKYDIYFYKYNAAGKKTIESVSGEESIGSISSSDNAEFATNAVEITTDCSTTSSCPKCVKQASSVQRERVIGMRVQVYNSEGEMLSEYHSSNSTRAIADKRDGDS